MSFNRKKHPGKKKKPQVESLSIINRTTSANIEQLAKIANTLDSIDRLRPLAARFDMVIARNLVPYPFHIVLLNFVSSLQKLVLDGFTNFEQYEITKREAEIRFQEQGYSLEEGLMHLSQSEYSIKIYQEMHANFNRYAGIFLRCTNGEDQIDFSSISAPTLLQLYQLAEEYAESCRAKALAELPFYGNLSDHFDDNQVRIILTVLIVSILLMTDRLVKTTSQQIANLFAKGKLQHPPKIQRLIDKYENQQINGLEAIELLKYLNNLKQNYEKALNNNAQPSAVFCLIMLVIAVYLYNSENPFFVVPAIITCCGFAYSAYASEALVKEEKNAKAALDSKLNSTINMTQRLFAEKMATYKIESGSHFDFTSIIVHFAARSHRHQVSMSATKNIIREIFDSYQIKIQNSWDDKIAIAARTLPNEENVETIAKEIDERLQQYNEQVKERKKFVKQIGSLSDALGVIAEQVEKSNDTITSSVCFYIRLSKEEDIERVKQLFPQDTISLIKEDIYAVAGSAPANQKELDKFITEINARKNSSGFIEEAEECDVRPVNKDDNNNNNHPQTIPNDKNISTNEKQSTINWPNNISYRENVNENSNTENTIYPFAVASNSSIPKDTFFARITIPLTLFDTHVSKKIQQMIENPHFVRGQTGSQGFIRKKHKVDTDNAGTQEADFKFKILGDHGVGDIRLFGRIIKSEDGIRELFSVDWYKLKGH